MKNQPFPIAEAVTVNYRHLLSAITQPLLGILGLYNFYSSHSVAVICKEQDHIAKTAGHQSSLG